MHCTMTTGIPFFCKFSLHSVHGIWSFERSSLSKEVDGTKGQFFAKIIYLFDNCRKT
jgi:hypothetical protein